jgi:hypothetical protein
MKLSSKSYNMFDAAMNIDAIATRSETFIVRRFRKLKEGQYRKREC